jgi:hypothetical protein
MIDPVLFKYNPLVLAPNLSSGERAAHPII